MVPFTPRRRVCRWMWASHARVILALLTVGWIVTEVLRAKREIIRASGEEPEPFRGERIFITGIHWNNEKVLREHWIPAVVALSKELGPERVFVSVQESGSWDDSKGALKTLDTQLGELGIPRRIILDHTTHEDEINKPVDKIGWVETPRGQTELRRIPYLARLRNLVMEPLYQVNQTYHKILFLNDVVFSSRDVRKLLSTRDGRYAAACSLDFSKPPAFYDTFALRDVEGHESLMQTWPYFRARASRAAVKTGQPVPVTSCWNGIVAMDAAPFYENPPLLFRGIDDDLAKYHLEGSECCLIHADNWQSGKEGVWLNPNIRVGYNPEAYAAVNPAASVCWVRITAILRGIWENRTRRWFTAPWIKRNMVKNRLESWKRQYNREEPGTFCLINEMQVLVHNGWAHV